MEMFQKSTQYGLLLRAEHFLCQKVITHFSDFMQNISFYTLR
ncbi:hypothetical protein A1U5_03501 [Escherichia coli KTE66]|nr:hypothetical protein A1U5_03501 [Escherichia coli KTE66]